MQQNNKPKIVIIFPKYLQEINNHYPYWYRLFENVSNKLDIFILFESGRISGNLNYKYYLQKIQFKPINLIERLIILIYLRLNGYSVFYSYYSQFGLLLSKLVTSIFGGRTWLWNCEYYQNKPENVLLNLTMRNADSLVTGHEKIANQYKKIFNLKYKPIRIVRNWVKSEDIFPKRYINNKPNTVLFIHHLSSRKGSRLLPLILERTLKKDKNFIFNIIGNGPDFNYLKKWIKTSNYKKNINLYKNIPLTSIQNFYLKSDILILPSLAEGFPRVILEAMYYGVPYVAFNVGCVWEISPQSLKKFIVDTGDVKQFVDKLFILKNMPINDRKRIIKDMSIKVKDYTLQKASEEFVRIFN